MTVRYAGTYAQNNKYQVWQKHSCFFRWWVHSRPKHVQIDKYTKNKLCTKFVLFKRILYMITLRNLLSRRAQSGRWSSFGKRLWLTESHIVLIISSFIYCFIYSIYSWYKQWSSISSKTTRSFLRNWHSHFSVLLPTPHSYTTDFLTGLLASIISSKCFLI